MHGNLSLQFRYLIFCETSTFGHAVPTSPQLHLDLHTCIIHLSSTPPPRPSPAYYFMLCLESTVLGSALTELPLRNRLIMEARRLSGAGKLDNVENTLARRGIPSALSLWG